MDADDLLDWAVPLVEMACVEGGDAQLEQVIARLEPELQAGIGNAQLWHLLGLAWYNHSPCDRRAAKARDAFAQAVALEPGHQFAVLYSGYLAFDEGQFQEALGFFESVDDHYFRVVMDQAWRALKTEELKICCGVRLGATGTLEAAADWAQKCEQLEREEPGGAAAPWELLRTVAAEAAAGRISPEDVKQFAALLAQVIDAQGLMGGAIESEVRHLAELGPE